MELDKRVGDYAAAIVRDIDLLIADAANLNEDQQKFADVIKRYAVLFQSQYNESLSYFAELGDEGRMRAHDLRRPLGIIEGYAEIWSSGDFGSVSVSQTQLLQQIRDAHDFINNAFITWVNSDRPTP